MKLTKRNLILIFVPITFMLVIVLFPGFFYQNLIDPITRIFWLLIRSILSINQEILWTLLIVIALVVGLMMIPDRNSRLVLEDLVSICREKQRKSAIAVNPFG